MLYKRQSILRFDGKKNKTGLSKVNVYSLWFTAAAKLHNPAFVPLQLRAEWETETFCSIFAKLPFSQPNAAPGCILWLFIMINFIFRKPVLLSSFYYFYFKACLAFLFLLNSQFHSICFTIFSKFVYLLLFYQKFILLSFIFRFLYSLYYVHLLLFSFKSFLESFMRSIMTFSSIWAIYIHTCI